MVSFVVVGQFNGGMATERWRIETGVGDDADDDTKCGSHDSYPGRTFCRREHLDRRIGQRTTKLHEQGWNLSEDEQVAEDEAAIAAERQGQAIIAVPDELLPEIRRLLAAYRAKSA